MSDEAAPVVAPVEAPASAPEKPAEPKPDEKPAEPKPDAQEAKAEKARRLALKVDGEEEELDLDNPEHLTKAQKWAQLGKAKDKRFEEAKTLRKEAEEKEGKARELITAMKEKPVEFAAAAKAFGVDPVKFAQAILQPMIEAQLEEERLASMSPEEKRTHEMERRLAEYERKDKERAHAEELTKAEQEKQAHAAKVAERSDKLSNTVMEALEQTKLPKNQRTALQLVSLMEAALENGQDLDPVHLARELEEMTRAETQALLEQADDEQLASIVGKKAQDRMRMAAVRAFKKGNPLADPQAQVADGAKAQQPVKPKYSGWNATARDIALGKF